MKELIGTKFNLMLQNQHASLHLKQLIVLDLERGFQVSILIFVASDPKTFASERE